MTARVNVSSRRGMGGFLALLGGAAMIVSVFVPWFGTTASYSGWDSVVKSVENVSGTGDFFQAHWLSTSGFSPYFTGLSVLIAGVLLVLIGLAMLFSLKGGAFRLPGIAVFLLGLLALLIAVVGVTNLISLFATRGSGQISPEWGLYLLTAGAAVGLIGTWIGLGRGDTA